MNKSFSKSVAKKIILQNENTQIFLLVGPCRSGTTAFQRVFGEVGIESWYQPIKTIIRGGNHEKDYSFEIPDIPKVMLKETLGPFPGAETCFNPIEILMEAGVAKENIHLLTITREPISTACSWLGIGDQRAERRVNSIGNLVRCYENIIRLIAYTEEHAISHTPYVYELLRDHDPEVVRRLLLDELGIAYTEDRVNWSELPPVEMPTRFNKFIGEDENYHDIGLHTKLNRSSGLTYYGKSINELTKYVDDSLLSLLINGGAFCFYHTHKEMCSERFGLPIKDADIPVRLTQR
jgi:hypothetical protein